MEQTLWLKTAADWYLFSWDKWTLTSVHFSPWFCYRESVISFTHFWITIGWEHVHVELQRNSRKAALGETPNVFYVGISSPLPFCCFFSRQSETLVEEVASWKWYWKWGTPGFQAIQVPLNTGWILHSSASLWQSACAGVWGAVVFGSLVRGFASKSNNFWTFSGLASKCSFCNGVKKIFFHFGPVLSRPHPFTDSTCQPFPGDSHCLKYCLVWILTKIKIALLKKIKVTLT